MATVMSFLYVRVEQILKQHKPNWTVSMDERAPFSRVVAFVCDEMTWQDFSVCCNAVYVTPQNWKTAFLRYKPEVLFCESAWFGLDRYDGCWRGQVYKSDRVLYNNRRNLLEMLVYCSENKIATVFWNKEDPTYFGNPHYNFVDTALRFDHVLTTAEECLPMYRALGHESVNLWMFGFSPQIFFPPKEGQAKENVAVYAGSWFADHPQRCADMARVFDMVLDCGVELVIYDRQMNSHKAENRFPNKYKAYVRSPVRFDELGKIYRRAKYVININTVTDSKTMFARRVFEAMACGCIIVSNHSDGLKEMFGHKIWFGDETFDASKCESIVRENIETVFSSHTCQNRWEDLMGMLKISD